MGIGENFYTIGSRLGCDYPSILTNMLTNQNKVITDYRELHKKVEAHRVLGHKVVCTVGSWDILHIGHLRYLNRAREFGDVLIVGTDSDRGIKLYKNPLRPIIPEGERMEMLSYQDCVSYVTLIDDIDEKGVWQMGLIQEVPVNVFVAVEGDSYTPEQKKRITQLCGELAILPRQAKNTSSTDIIQNVLKKQLIEMVNKFKHGS